MSNIDDNPNGANSASADAESRREVLLKTFDLSKSEIEDLIKSCLAEHHLQVEGYEVQTLIKEWKSLYFRTFGREIEDTDFAITEIGQFIAGHVAFENIEKSCREV